MAIETAPKLNLIDMQVQKYVARGERRNGKAV